MARFTSPLDNVRVAAPCPADWGRMTGDERVRFCAQCNLSVYNLSGMTRTEAEALLYKSEGRLCVRFYRRPDGTILTQQCPVGLRALKARVTRGASAAFSAVLSFVAGVGLHNAASGDNSRPPKPSLPVMGAMVVRDVEPAVRLAPTPDTVFMGEAVVGVLAVEEESARDAMPTRPVHIRRPSRKR